MTRAELAKAHATRVADAFESRLRTAESQPFEFAPGVPDDDAPTPGELPLAKLQISPAPSAHDMTDPSRRDPSRL